MEEPLGRGATGPDEGENYECSESNESRHLRC
jgi:hypothetical protein